MTNEKNLLQILGQIIEQNLRNSKKYQGVITRQEPNGAHTNIYYDSFNFSKDHIDKSTLDALQKEIPDESLHAPIVYTCQHIYLTAVLMTASGNIYANNILENLLAAEARNICNSLNTQEEFIVEISVLSELERSFTLPGWKRKVLNIFDMSIRAHQSGIAASEFLSRLFCTSIFEKDLSSFPDANSPQAIIDQVELFVLALSLGLSRPIKLDDIRVVPKKWKFSPTIPIHFPRMWGYWDDSARNASSNRFWSQTPGSIFKKEDEEDINRCTKWLALLESVPGARHPLAMIQRGIWQTFSLSNSPEYLANSKALTAITDILLGMEGLVRRSSSTYEGQYRLKFQTAWRKIIDALPKYHERSKSSRNITEKLYTLRCTVAHGGVDSLPNNLRELKVSLGDSWNPNLYRPNDVAFMLAQWVRYVLQGFLSDQNLLSSLYSETEVKLAKNKFKVAWNRMISSLLLD